MSEHTVAVRLNRREEIRITRTEFNGHPLIKIRVWFPASDGEMRPAKGQGFAFRVDLVPELLAALSELGEVTR